ncbi:hypothetical protein D3C75_1023950 [compost metagenome]
MEPGSLSYRGAGSLQRLSFTPQSDVWRKRRQCALDRRRGGGLDGAVAYRQFGGTAGLDPAGSPQLYAQRVFSKSRSSGRADGTGNRRGAFTPAGAGPAGHRYLSSQLPSAAAQGRRGSTAERLGRVKNAAVNHRRGAYFLRGLHGLPCSGKGGANGWCQAFTGAEYQSVCRYTRQCD